MNTQDLNDWLRQDDRVIRFTISEGDYPHVTIYIDNGWYEKTGKPYDLISATVTHDSVTFAPYQSEGITMKPEALYMTVRIANKIYIGYQEFINKRKVKA